MQVKFDPGISLAAFNKATDVVLREAGACSSDSSRDIIRFAFEYAEATLEELANENIPVIHKRLVVARA